ncbi:nuclear transport factor 2 family protein [Christiangramia portivictoriae]|uniref:nuclear transport factor 2 family protein n=1 Tax=Christiangramia portivictoriae TaxID=326069 RepID=UPI0003FA638C|nr:nuclear transport factor 2 family protein [Christiangramia portivictoriae]
MKNSALKILFVIAFLTMLPSHAQVKDSEKNKTAIRERIDETLDSWHLAASNTEFDKYFGLMTSDAVFIGTDATENWTAEEFKKFARPYFDAGKAWNFTSLERYIYVHQNSKIAWFDELLDTQMGICRGSGVVAKENGTWKIHHYVLSIAVPNENVEELTSLKSEFDKNLISELKNK